MVGLVSVAGIELAAETVASWVGAPGVGRLLEALALTLPVQFLSRVAGARLERTLDFRRIATIELASQLAFLAVTVPLAFAGYGSWSLVFGWMTQTGFYFVLAHLTARCVPRFAWDKAVARQILSYGLALYVANWIWQLRLLANPFIVGHFLGAAAVGQIAMAIRLAEGLSFMRLITWRLSIAALARIQADPAKLATAITEGMQLQMLAIAPILLAFSWAGGWLVPQSLAAKSRGLPISCTGFALQFSIQHARIGSLCHPQEL
jgi:O-antigen/teichoic acid export membrane protein